MRIIKQKKMVKRKANQHIPKIIADLSEGRYSLKRYQKEKEISLDYVELRNCLKN